MGWVQCTQFMETTLKTTKQSCQNYLKYGQGSRSFNRFAQTGLRITQSRTEES